MLLGSRGEGTPGCTLRGWEHSGSHSEALTQPPSPRPAALLHLQKHVQCRATLSHSQVLERACNHVTPPKKNYPKVQERTMATAMEWN